MTESIPPTPSPLLPRLYRSKLTYVALAVVALSLGLQFWPSSQHEHQHHEGHDADTSGESAKQWTCSMHPQIRADQPGQCPICGMDLIPVSSGAAPVEGRVQLTERAKELARVHTVMVQRSSQANLGTRLLGRVEASEDTLKRVTAWIGGRIDRLHVRTTGERIKAGQAVATLYSPDVYTAHQDLLLARKQLERMQSSADIVRRGAESALEAARQRLRLLGVPEATLSKMEEASSPTRSIAIYSQYSGTVIDRLASEGSYIQTGAELYRLADLSTVWILLEAYDTDLERIQLGQEASVTVEGIADQTFEGKVAFVDPTVDPQKRTARVRIEMNNESGLLRPGMFASARLRQDQPADQKAALVVPKTAPLFTGTRSIVYVEHNSPDGFSYEPREVRLGPQIGSEYPVVAGLSEGERIVARGAFAIDADLQIQGGASMMNSTGETSIVLPAAIDLSATERELLAPLVRAYLDVQSALASDDLPKAIQASKQLYSAAESLELTSPALAMQTWRVIQPPMANAARTLSAAPSIEVARAAFEKLSAQIEQLLVSFGNPTDQALSLARCPMAMGSKGATWVQAGEELRNAYFGASMLDCGSFEETIEPGAALHREQGSQH